MFSFATSKNNETLKIFLSIGSCTHNDFPGIQIWVARVPQKKTFFAIDERLLIKKASSKLHIAGTYAMMRNEL